MMYGMQMKDAIQRLQNMVLPALAAWLLTAGSVAAPAADSEAQLPHLQKRSNAVQLLVDGDPTSCSQASCTTPAPPAPATWSRSGRDSQQCI
jgi:hypothetical protein